jgi:hypothetical protein
VNPGKNPAFRPVYGNLGCKNIHGLSKEDLLQIALDWDRRNAPLFFDDPNIEAKATDAQRNALIKEVDARKKTKGTKPKAGGTDHPTRGGKKAAGKRGQAQTAKTTTARPRQGKERAQEEIASSDDGTADDDQDGDARMAEREDAVESTPMIDPTADAVSSPLDGKRKRAYTTTSAANKRARASRSNPTRSSLIVKLKMLTSTRVSETDDDENMALADDNDQGPSDRLTQRQTAGDMHKANTRRALKQPVSRLRHSVASPLELAKSMEDAESNLIDAVAAPEKPGHISGTSASDKTPEELSSRRQSPNINKDKANVPESDAVDNASDEIEESSQEDAASNGSSPSPEYVQQTIRMPARKRRSKNKLPEHGADGEPGSDKAAQTAQADEPWPKDENGHDVVFGWDGTYVDYLHSESSEEEREVPYSFLNGLERMRRDQRQAKRQYEQAKKEAEARGEVYVPEPVEEEYDWTKHM